jgi:hypothetical protein
MLINVQRKTQTELINEMKRKGGLIKWQPGMQLPTDLANAMLKNANGDVATSATGYQYTIQTTTLIRAKVVEQVFYEIPFEQFVPVEVGEGAWLEFIETNTTFDSAGDFESGINNVSDPSNIPQVSAALSPVNQKVVTWIKGFQYSNVEVSKALASNNWNPITSKQAALKRNWDLGLQKIAFLGSLSDPVNIQGLLSQSQVNINTTIITALISSLSGTPATFMSIVQQLLADYFANSNNTRMPDTFLMPTSDYLGLGVAVSASFPNVMMLDWLLEAFKKITQNPNFAIRHTIYNEQSVNTGYWRAGGTNRYVLYRHDPETVRMVVPVPFILNAPNTPDNFHWNGVAAGQFTGVVSYRPREIRYYDWHS